MLKFMLMYHSKSRDNTEKLFFGYPPKRPTFDLTVNSNYDPMSVDNMDDGLALIKEPI